MQKTRISPKAVRQRKEKCKLGVSEGLPPEFRLAKCRCFNNGQSPQNFPKTHVPIVLVSTDAVF